MPFVKGMARPAGSGRKPGNPDVVRHVRTLPNVIPRLTKLAKDVRDRLEEMGLDPISALVRVGVKAEEKGELGIARACYAELANYVYPRLRAVEHSGLVATVNLSDADPFDAITRELSRIADRARAGETPPSVQ